MTRNADPAFIAALGAADTSGLDVRRFLYVKAKTRGDDPEPYEVGFWTGDYDYTVTVRDGETGELVSRIYYGMGIALRIPKIPRTSDMTIQTIVVELSQINPIVENLVRGANVRFAKVDIHEGLITPHGTTLVSAPEITFLGEVDGDPITTPSAGNEGSVQLEIVSDAIRALTRTNPKTNSHESQKLRSNDQFARYSSLIENMEAPWGETTAKAATSKPSTSQRGAPR